MNTKFEITGFLRTFPFLCTEGIVEKPKEVEKVEAIHLTPDSIEKILADTPELDGASGSLVGIYDSRQIFLLDKKGKKLLEVKQSGYYTHNEAYQDNESWEGETVGESFLQLDGKLDSLRFIVQKHTGYTVRDHHSVGGFAVKLFKVPESFSPTKWVEKKMSEINYFNEKQP